MERSYDGRTRQAGAGVGFGGIRAWDTTCPDEGGAIAVSVSEGIEHVAGAGQPVRAGVAVCEDGQDSGDRKVMRGEFGAVGATGGEGESLCGAGGERK